MNICLNMIVKNEEAVIQRCLHSTLGLIDKIVILDTGSTDKTIEIIKNFGKIHNIETFVYLKEFENFEISRNLAISCAKKHNADWIFWIDADEMLFGNNNQKQSLKNFILNSENSSFNLKTIFGNCQYYRKQFFKVSKNFKWCGAFHEYIHSKNDNLCTNIDDIYTFVTTDGNSHKDLEKYKNHAIILQKEFEKTGDVRWKFYEAQSWENYKNFENAAKCYEERILLNGFEEEQYIAKLRLYRINRKIINGFQFHNRVELLFEVINDFLNIDIAYCLELAKKGVEIILSKIWQKSILFLETDIYIWRFFDIAFICALRANDFSFHTLCKYLLEQNIENIPSSDKTRILKNFEYDLIFK